MYTNISFAKNKDMRKSTKILLVFFVLTFVPSLILGRYIFAGITPTEKGFAFNFDVLGIVAIVLMIVSNIFGFILFFRFIMSQPMAKAIFFSSLPLMLIYGALMFLLVETTTFQNDTAQSVRTLLNLSPDNAYNTVLWAILITIIFVMLMFLNFFILCKPLNKVEKIVARLGDGRVKESKLKLGGIKQFDNIEHGLNKINNNIRNNENSVKQANLEAQKFIPKQFFKFFGKSSIAELELGNQVKKKATLISVKLSGLETSKEMSLEENFNFLNSYLNVISPLVRRFGGFVDKYYGEGILAVFGKAENALDCSHAISRAISVKNRQNKTLPNVKERIVIMTSQVIFGIVGEEEHKMPTIVSSIITEMDRIDQICKMMESQVVFADNMLDNLPLNYKFLYRNIGEITLFDKQRTLLFEDLEVMPRDKCSKLVKSKAIFERGVLCYENGDYDEACRQFSEALRIAPNDKGCYVYYNKAKEKIINL